MSLPQATHGGELAIGELSLACYVLEDRMRVLGQDALPKAFGQTPWEKGGDDDSSSRRSSQITTCSPSLVSNCEKTARLAGVSYQA